jgi:hypothetical protein
MATPVSQLFELAFMNFFEQPDDLKFLIPYRNFALALNTH